MKKIIFHLILIAPLILHAQKNTEELSDEAFKKIEASKSGNYKDVLFSFMQAAFKSTDINEKKLELNSTLYKILADNNKEIFSNYTRNQIRFVRNFQLNLKLDFDDKFKSKGFTSGITLAIINGRDKSFVDYTETLLQVKYDDYLDLLHEAQNEQIIAKEKDDDVTDASEIILNQEIIPDDKKVLVTKMKNSISSKIASSKKYNDLKDAEGNAISISDNDSFVTYIHSIKSKLDKDLESKPLLTISADGSTNTNGKFDKASFGTIFLKGNKGAWNEIDVRAKLTYTDTLQTTHLPQTAFNAKAGMNFKIGKDIKQQSYFEVKVYGEYNTVFNNLIADEKKNNFLANTDIRVRLTDDLWFPITIKYDTNTANFLGFLNVTYNFGSK